MRFLNFWHWLKTGFIGLAALVIVGYADAQTAPPRDAKNASFWERVDNPPPNPLQPPRSAYKPLAQLLGTGRPFLPIATPGSTRISAQALDEASQFAEATNSQALIILHKGIVQLEQYYQGTQAETEFSSHSFAKTLNALAVGAAIADGAITSADQTASTWLPEWRDGKRDAITIRQLLTMSGGFKATPSSDPASHYMQLHYGADVEAIVRDAPLAYAPGTAFEYDNDNLHALGLIIERATKKSYLDYVSTRIWQRIGASNAEIVVDREGGRALAWCCILSKPRDWARLGQLLLGRGEWQGDRVVPGPWINDMRKPSANNPQFGFQLHLGAAWMNPRLNWSFEAQKASLVAADAPDLYYLSGAGGMQLAIIPSDELVILRVGKNAPGWREQALPNLLHAALHPQPSARQSGQATDWAWLYDWRIGTRQFDKPTVFDRTQPTYWPAERVAGVASQAANPVPRQLGRCLDESKIGPAMAELERTKSYSFLVWRDGVVEVERYWPGFDADTRAESASMHKSVLGLLVGQAVADGSIASIDAPVSRWLTEWSGDPRGAITVRQMLQMASGLEPIKFDMTPRSPSSLFQLGSDVIAVPLAFRLADKPGAQFNYISGVSQLLALIVERATQRRYADYLSERLWKPLGAANAYVTLDRPGGFARASASLLATPEDWLRLGLLFADRGRVDGKQVVEPGWIEAMVAPSPANPNYGFQLWRASPHAAKRGYNSATNATVPAKEPFLASDMVYFDGAGAQRVYVSAKERLVIVRLGRAVFDWDDSMIPNIVTEAARKCAPRR